MSLSWIKLHANLPGHPKSQLLEAELDTPMAWAHVVQLWLWASQMRPSGDLSGFPAWLVARGAGWSGDADVFIEALRTVGFLDGWVLHDWDEEQGAHMRKAEKDRARAAARREAAKAERAAESKESPPARRATVAEPSRDNPPAVAGERRGEERREEERERADALAAGGEQETQKQVRPAAAPSGAQGRGHRRFASRMPHEQALWRETPEELLAAPDPDRPARTFDDCLAERYPALDGQRGRPTRLQRLKAKWPAFEKKFFAHGPASAFPAVIDWIGEGYDRHRRDWERDGNVDPALMRSAPSTGRAPRPVDDRPTDDA